MKLRLLISGSKINPNTIGQFFISNFDSTIEYEILEYPDQFVKMLDSYYYKIGYRIFPSLIVRKMDKLLIQQVERFKPDVVLIFKGMEISKTSLSKIRSKGIKLVNYNFDHPFDFFSRGTGNRFVLEAIPYYDLHISYSSIIARQVSDKFRVKSAQIPFGFQLTLDQFEKVMQANLKEINRVCFVGNPDSLRIQAIHELLVSEIPIDLYGFGWEKVFKEKNSYLTIHLPRVKRSFWSDPLEFWCKLRQYRVQLNFYRPHNIGSHNLRVFEVPAVGGILLTPHSEEVEGYFKRDEEIIFYNDIESLKFQCKKLLKMEPEQVNHIRNKARNRSIECDYSYKHRTKELLSLLSQTIIEA